MDTRERFKRFLQVKMIEAILGEMPEDAGPPSNLENKEIGDTVKLLFPLAVTYLCDYETGKQLGSNFSADAVKEHQDLLENEAIVVETDTGWTYNCGHCAADHPAFTTIYFPHNKTKYRVNEENLQLVEKSKKD